VVWHVRTRSRTIPTVRRLDETARRSAVVVAMVALALFLVAAWIARGDGLQIIDHGARTLIREGRPPALEQPMRIISLLGSGDVLLPVTFLGSAVLWSLRYRALAVILPGAAVTTSATLALMKWMINKPRPTLRGYGFPSGHVYGVTVFVIVVVYLLWAFRAPRRWQRVAQGIGVAFVTAVGYSRIYVNAHWLSDVVGGLLAGIAFALGVVLVLNTRAR
jgi:cation-transporting P-type ATPase E